MVLSVSISSHGVNRREFTLGGTATVTCTSGAFAKPNVTGAPSKRHTIRANGSYLEGVTSLGKKNTQKHSNFLPGASEGRSAKQVVAPIPQSKIEQLLGQVFRAHNASAYSFYFLDLPGWDLGVVKNNVAEIKQIQSQGKNWSPVASIPSARVVLSVPPPMQALPAVYQLCITLDSLGIVVPVAAAQIVSAGFAAGLVTRLVLKKLGDRSSQNYVDKFTLLSSNPDDMFNGYGSTEDSFNARLSVVAQQRAFQASGFFLGWNAGGDISGEPGAVSAIWELLKSRFSWEDLGQLMSYGLSYAIAFLRVQDAMQLANTPNGGGRVTDPNVVLQKLKGDDQISALQQVIFDCFHGMLSTFQVAISGNQAMPATLLAYRDFLDGYTRGELNAAETVFVEVLQVGYGIGYRDGFTVGYERGYSDGYAQGYQDGKAVNWSNVLHDVVNGVSAVATIISFFA